MPFDLFAVMLGTNDIVGTLRPNAEETAHRMEKLIDFVQKLMPESGQDNAGNKGKPSLPGILLIAPPAIVLTDQAYAEPYIAGDKNFATLYKEEGEKLCRYYQEIAKSRNLFFADTSDWLLQFKTGKFRQVCTGLYWKGKRNGCNRTWTEQDRNT